MSLWPIGPGPGDTGAHRVRLPVHSGRRRRLSSHRLLALVAVVAWVWLIVVAAVGLVGCTASQGAQAVQYIPVVLEAASTFSKAAQAHLESGQEVRDMPVKCSTEWVPRERLVLLLCEGKVPRRNGESERGL